jgi:hypothetical protein
MHELDERLKPGSEIDLVEREGRGFRGEFVRADEQGILLAGYGGVQGRRVPAADIITITRKGDSLKNGLLIGAGIGLASGLLVASGNDSDGTDWCDGSECAGFVVFSTATYAGIGVLIDHLVKGREVVYRAPAARVSWSVAPYPVKHGAGVRVAMGF